MECPSKLDSNVFAAPLIRGRPLVSVGLAVIVAVVRHEVAHALVGTDHVVGDAM